VARDEQRDDEHQRNGATDDPGGHAGGDTTLSVGRCPGREGQGGDGGDRQ